MGIIFLMPFIGRWKLGHRFNVGLLFALLGGAGVLTFLARSEDKGNAGYQAAVKSADAAQERIHVLAAGPSGIPPTGAVELLRNDPLIQGPKLFAQKCAACHRHGGTDGLGNTLKEPQSASDLKGFASRAWIADLLDPERVGGTNYFGGTKFAGGKMVKFVRKQVAGYTPEQHEQLRKVIMAVSAEARLESQSTQDKSDQKSIAEGAGFLRDAMRCTECHQFGKADEDATAPNLTKYGSKEWLRGLLQNPAHTDYYGERNDRMPAFGDKQIMSDSEMNLVIDWLRGEWTGAAQLQPGNKNSTR
jgi:ubiquinol-cytochrome c reductase cytochrome b subunit